MKRRSRDNNDDERGQLEREAMAELQRQAGGPPPSRPSASPGAPRPAWGGPAAPATFGTRAGRPAEPAPEPTWRARRPAPRPAPEPEPEEEWAVDEDVAEEDQDEAWAEGDWEDDPDGGEGGPMGLLGIPLDYDATGIALQQLAERSNVRRPADFVVGVDAFEAEQTRDRAMAQFLERQKVRQLQDAELAAARAAASPHASPPQKRAAFPPLSPGLSAKSLVMQPVAAPPLNRPQPPLSAPKPAARKPVTKTAVTKAAVTKRAGTKGAGTKVAVTKGAVAKGRATATDGAPKGRAASPAAAVKAEAPRKAAPDAPRRGRATRPASPVAAVTAEEPRKAPLKAPLKASKKAPVAKVPTGRREKVRLPVKEAEPPASASTKAAAEAAAPAAKVVGGTRRGATVSTRPRRGS